MNSARRTISSLIFFLSVCICWDFAVTAQNQLPSFPGAQGGGAASVGGSGRNGTGTPQVIEVTTTADSGSGSLRNCMAASGPRTCVFRVNGLFTFKSRASISSPYITIDGQSAPGEVVIGGAGQQGEQIFINTHDVVIRYLTYDGFVPGATGPDSGTVCCEMASGDVFNIVWDHISARWVGNKPFPMVSNDAGSVHNVSLQWILMYEPNSCHPVGYGTLYVSGTSPTDLKNTNNDVHHSMFVNIDHRIPLNQSGVNTRAVNNINYNWGQFASLSMGGVRSDYISNKYIDGHDDPAKLVTVHCGSSTFPNGNEINYQNGHVFLGEVGNNPSDTTGNPGGDNEGPPSFYLLNNVGRAGNTYNGGNNSATNVVNDSGQIAMTHQGTEGGDSGSAMPGSWFRSTPLPSQTFPIVAMPVTSLDSAITATVGNYAHLDCHGAAVNHRNSQDTRVINQYLALGGGNTYFGQYPSPSPVGGSLCTETLHDGIPNQWKTDNALSTIDVNLWKTIAPNGYTYLENYMYGNGNVAPPPNGGQPVAPTGVTATPH